MHDTTYSDGGRALPSQPTNDHDRTDQLEGGTTAPRWVQDDQRSAQPEHRADGVQSDPPATYVSEEPVTSATNPPAMPVFDKTDWVGSLKAAWPVIEWVVLHFTGAAYLLLTMFPMLKAFTTIPALLLHGVVPLLGMVALFNMWMFYGLVMKGRMWWSFMVVFFIIGWTYDF